ncbi:hypothetical protein IWQ56_004134 [Coemansia nantahalensis]|uniref:Uncharacterized protein n=1 Tax=Coemansia nantahalensis TaxID=2789366 RepID=A0ACC1K3S9_9FUNG|nr:hypothetical protein IWQ56_004134 [Coemansia nantahalensis]KAJ2772754.1 hypothetical protein IWQ57_001626 [Coemansia nantahalensis]
MSLGRASGDGTGEDGRPAASVQREAGAELVPNAASMLQVLLPALKSLDGQLEAVWARQDTLNEVLNRLSAELEQFDELVLPPGGGAGARPEGGWEATESQLAAQRLRAARTKIAAVNATLKNVRTRLDGVSMLAQARILQTQQQQQR